jgi:4-diphosphocytidyl-2-C-methyl-D-erythritol kinase
MHETAYAKINLALHVRRRRDDGYHDLESLFAFAEDGDQLSVSSSDDLTLQIDGPFAEGLSNGPDNLVLRAAAALREAGGVSAGAQLHLAKNLPVASGIGGGSADAAAALRLLARHWKLDLDMMPIAANLGADVPACLFSRSVKGEGKGDQLEPFTNPWVGAPLLLVNPRIPLSTAAVFKAWDGVDRGALDEARPESWRNDLEAPAFSQVPQIKEILDQLADCEGVLLARMSGSGATSFAIFEREEARDLAATRFRDCWTLATRIRP